jgi:hypothetical protein
MEPAANFRRMVLGLPHSAKDYVSVAFTAELAELLGLDLVGVFAEEQGLIDLALLPCVREFRIFGDGWHRLDAAQLAQRSSAAAAEARRLFVDVAKALRIGARFDLVKGPIWDAVGSQSMPDDIVAIIEPQNPAERVTYQFTQFIETALHAQAGVLLVPSRIRRRTGPVVAIAESEHDMSVQVGLRVAQAVREKLLVLAPVVAEEPAGRPVGPGDVAVERRSLRGGKIGLAELGSILAIAGERLVVLGRGVDTRLPFQLASERGVPVLVTPRGETASRPAG